MGKSKPRNYHEWNGEGAQRNQCVTASDVITVYAFNIKVKASGRISGNCQLKGTTSCDILPVISYNLNCNLLFYYKVSTTDPYFLILFSNNGEILLLLIPFKYT